MMYKGLLLEIDVGTTGTKYSIYDFDEKRVASAYWEYLMLHPRLGWTEQDPSRWWDAVCCNLQTIFQSQDIDKNRIATVGTSSTNVASLADRQGQPLCSTISLHSQRSGPQVERLKENIGEERIYVLAANRIANGFLSLPVPRWLVKNRPDLIKGAHKLMVSCDYVIQKFIRELAMNRLRVGLILMADIRTG